MIILQTFLKFLKNKKILRATFILYFLAIVAIIYLTFFIKFGFNFDTNEINEKNVNFFYVLYRNLVLIFKSYLFGLLSCGFYSIFIFCYNIFSVGIISNFLASNGYMKLFYKMVPHGILEIFGITLSLVMVAYFWITILAKIPKIVKMEETFKNIFFEDIKLLLSSLVFQLIIFIFAGLVEVMVSWIKVI